MGLTKMKKDVKQKATEAKKDDLAVKVELKLPAHVKHEPFDFMDRLFSGLRVVGMGCEDVPSGHGKVKGYFVQSDLEPSNRPFYLPAGVVPRSAVDEFRRDVFGPLAKSKTGTS